MEIVTDIDVRKAVLVHVAERHGQSPIAWRSSQCLAIFIEESTCVPRDSAEATHAVVQEEKIRLTMFENFALRSEFEIVGKLGRDDPPAIYIQQRKASGPDRCRAIVGHVKVQVAVPIYIRQRQRCGTE